MRSLPIKKELISRSIKQESEFPDWLPDPTHVEHARGIMKLCYVDNFRQRRRATAAEVDEEEEEEAARARKRRQAEADLLISTSP